MHTKLHWEFFTLLIPAAFVFSLVLRLLRVFPLETISGGEGMAPLVPASLTLIMLWVLIMGVLCLVFVQTMKSCSYWYRSFSGSHGLRSEWRYSYCPEFESSSKNLGSHSAPMAFRSRAPARCCSSRMDFSSVAASWSSFSMARETFCQSFTDSKVPWSDMGTV